MKRNIENNNILKTENGYVITIQKHYSDIIMTKNFIVAYNKEEQELIIYDQNFIMLEKLSSVLSIKEYRYNDNTVIIVINQNGLSSSIILYIHEDVYKICDPLAIVNDISNPFYPPYVDFKHISFISSTKFLIILLYNGYLYLFLVATLKENSISFVSLLNELKYGHKNFHFSTKRFIVFNFCIYDLYTMTKMDHPLKAILHMPEYLSTNFDITHLIVKYSSKDILLLGFDNYHCVYIRGKIVYTYYSDRYDTSPFDFITDDIIYALQHRTYTKECSTVKINNKIIMWNKDMQPQEISIPEL